MANAKTPYETIDAQIHRPLPLRPWERITQRDASEAEVEASLSAMEAVGVDRAVIYADEDFVRDASARYPDKFAGILSFRRPEDLGDASKWMQRVRRSPFLLGLRIMGSVDEGWQLLSEGAWESVLASAEMHGVPVVFYLPYHLPLLRQAAAAHPALRVVVDHLGMPTPPFHPLTNELFETLPDLLGLASFENIAVKFSGVPALSAEAFPFTSLWRHIHPIVEAFGPHRLIWGSDYTRVTGRHRYPRHPAGRLTYAELVNFLRYTNELGERDKAIIFGGAHRKWFGWPTSEEGNPAGKESPDSESVQT